MINPDANLIPDFEKPALEATRDGLGKGLLELGRTDKNVVVLTADLGESTRANWFKEKFPGRFIECGVAEQNMIGVAAGLALSGKIPFACSFGVFVPGRCWDAVRISVCYNNANVKIASTHGGITVGPDGATHQALEDLASLRAIPNLSIIVPADALEAKKATIAAAQIKGPCYLRFGREELPVFTTEQTPFSIGRAEILRDGSDCAIIACGIMVYEALMAAEHLSREGIECTVVNCHTLKPLDKRTVARVAQRCGCVVTAEEHQFIGGLGGAVSEFLAQTKPVHMRLVGIRDSFGKSGSAQELLKAYGLTRKEIIDAVHEVLVLKLQNVFVAPPEARGLAVFPAISPEMYFKVHGGGIIKNIPELKKALQEMDDGTFSHHVNHERNDFSAWVRDVFKQRELAAVLRSRKTKREMVSLLSSWLRKNTSF